MRRPHILLAGDQSQLLDLLQMLPRSDYDVVGAAEDGQTLVAAAQFLMPDIVVVDIDRPKLRGMEAIRQLHKTVPDCHVILQSSHGEPERMSAAYAAGASIYFIIGGSHSVLSAIQTVIAQPGNTGKYSTVFSTGRS